MKVRVPIFKFFFRDNTLIVAFGKVALELKLSIRVVRTFDISEDTEDTELEEEAEAEGASRMGPVNKQGPLLKIKRFYKI